MLLKEIYSNNPNTIISFEVFPPKDDEDGSKLEKLIGHLSVLKKYSPAFVSLTYGAGGTNQSSSLNIIDRIQNEIGLCVMPHFTCVGSTRSQVTKYLDEIKQLDIQCILALRGDIPEGLEYARFDFNYANELVEFINQRTQLAIGVAGYPEGHKDALDINSDIKNLKKKVDAGADVVYTQMFFDTDKYFSFVEHARKIGINIPIIPGILPIMSYKQLCNMLSMAKVSVPDKLMKQLEKYKDNPDDVKKIGIEHATAQCQNLVENDVAGLHFFTLNTSKLICKILDNLQIKTVF